MADFIPLRVQIGDLTKEDEAETATLEARYAELIAELDAVTRRMTDIEDAAWRRANPALAKAHPKVEAS
jgi:hypothetical protein